MLLLRALTGWGPNRIYKALKELAKFLSIKVSMREYYAIHGFIYRDYAPHIWTPLTRAIVIEPLLEYLRSLGNTNVRVTREIQRQAMKFSR